MRIIGGPLDGQEIKPPTNWVEWVGYPVVKDSGPALPLTEDSPVTQSQIEFDVLYYRRGLVTDILYFCHDGRHA